MVNYKIIIANLKEVVFDLTIFHAGNWGIAAKLEMSNVGDKSDNLGVDWIFVLVLINA